MLYVGKQVRMLYVGRLQTAHGTRVRHKRDARLEAGRVRCMRHARARLGKATVLREIVVVLVLASPSGVVLEVCVWLRSSSNPEPRCWPYSCPARYRSSSR
jgi:hypothetical protein